MVEKKIEFEATVRSNTTPIGRFGRIVAKELADLVGKKVKVTIKIVDKA